MTAVFFGVTTRSYHYDRTVGRQEFTGIGFRAPMDVALGPDGLMYVVNRGFEYKPISVRVTMCTIDEKFLGQFAQFGEGDGDLFWPTSIALDRDQNVYVSDDWLNRVSIFDKKGEFLRKWGVTGSGDGEINKPSGIRFDKDDNLYMVDSGNNRVQKFTKDGKFLAKWGEAGNGQGQFNLPWGLTIDDKGDIYVADWRNDRIQKFSAEGEFLAEFGSSGSGVGEFNRPTGVAVDKDGDIYVADWRNDLVQVLTPDGRHITTFTGDAGLSKWGKDKLYVNPDQVKQRSLVRDLESERRFWGPRGVVIDGEGRIIIIDGNRHRLQVYQKDNYKYGGAPSPSPSPIKGEGI